MVGIFGKGKVLDHRILGSCEIHGDLRLGYYVYKGCWGCHYFNKSDDFPFIDVTEASEILGVHRSTIYRMIADNELDAILYERGRDSINGSLLLGARQKYHILKPE